MKNILTLAFLFLFVPGAGSQTAAERPASYGGFDKFVLGAPKSAFGGNLKWLTSYTRKEHQFNLYAYFSPAEPVETATVAFHSIVLIFDDSDKLADCSMSKFYLQKDMPRFEKNAGKDFKTILKFLATALGTEGEEKTYIKNSKVREKGREWKGTKVTVKASKTDTGTHCSIAVSFSSLNL